MRVRIAVTLGLISLLALPGVAADRTAQAKQLVTLLTKRDFAGAVKTFDEKVTQALPAEKLGQVWDDLIQKVGPFKQQVSTRVDKLTQNNQTYDIVFVTCQFEKAKLDVQVAYDAAGKVAGLFFKPVER